MDRRHIEPETYEPGGGPVMDGRGPARGTGGFTLAELMIVVAIIGVIATMAIPAYLKMLPHLRLKSAASDMRSALLIARTTAVAKNKKVRVVVNPADDTFAIEVYNGTGWDPATNVSVRNSNEYRNWTDVDIYTETGGRLSAPVATHNLASDMVEFRPDGTTGISGNPHEAVFLTNISKKTERYRLRIIANTGMIYTEKWSESKSKWEAP